jgi:endonuclease/exonuclease/phosphatase family metal-dependent hydrolase
MRTFRAATLNIWNRFGPWDERLPAIREGLKTVAPDVIGMQEVLRCADLDQGKVLGEDLGYNIAWGMASENHGFPVGNAILSRWPILTTAEVKLPNGGTDETRVLVYALLDAPFGKVPFFCTHLNWKLNQSNVRQLQTHAVAKAVNEIAPPGSFPPVLVGDFNAGPDADEVRFLKGLCQLEGQSVYFADAWDFNGPRELGPTFSKTNPHAEPLREPERRIDYVFVRGPDDAHRGEPLDAQVCFNRPFRGVYPSDHYGVVATITAGR